MIAQLVADVVQGPIDHPSFGQTLVVEPAVETTRANRYPSQAIIVTAAARRLIELSKDNQKLQTVLVQGERDPTIHPEFHEISSNLRELLNKWFPKARLVLLSNAPQLGRRQTRHALNFYDQPILKLEAGTQRTVAKLADDGVKILKEVLASMPRAEVERLIVRSRFVRGSVDNSKDNEVRAWIRNLNEIRPAAVQIHTLPRPSGKERPVTKTRMSEIADLVTEKTGIPVELCQG